MRRVVEALDGIPQAFGILFSDFVLLCKGIYHEMRHAEQFYRMAQGLAAGRLQFPDTSQQQVTQAVASVKGATSVKRGPRRSKRSR